MAMKNLTKLDKDYAAQAEKLKAIEAERKKAEEAYLLDLGKIYFQIRKKKEKSIDLVSVHSELKNELQTLKNEEKEKRQATQNEPES
ncbi:hypothetical protein ACVR1G_08270 [Streptococcus dentasini]